MTTKAESSNVNNKKCGDLGHVAPLPPKKPSRSIISSSIWDSSASPGDPVGSSPAWASGQSPGHATSAPNCSGVGHTKGAELCPC
ncbi:hypothetical protein HKD37_18G051183 [Glycine soja]